MEESISLSKIIQLLKSKSYLIFSFTIVGLFIGMIFSFLLLTPNYRSTVQVIVTQDNDNQIIQNTEVQANIQLVNTYNEIIKSPFIIEKVVADLAGEYTVSELSQRIRVSNETNSQVINISADAESRQKSVVIANVVAEKFKENASEVMKVGDIHILSNSKYSTSSTRKSLFMYIGISGVLGLVSGIITSFLIIALDTTLKTEDDILEQLSIPVLGTIGKIK